jgi:hypothetical protein
MTRNWLTRALTLSAAVPLAVVAALAAAPAAQAGPPGAILSAGPGPAPATVSITWESGPIGDTYWFALAPASYGIDTCDYDVWSAGPIDAIAGWYWASEATASGAVYTDVIGPRINGWDDADGTYPLTAGRQYTLCAFYEPYEFGPPMIVTTGSNREGMPDVVQQVGLPVTGTCDAIADTSLNWGGAPSGGWTKSYAMWPRDGKGGWVCTRTLTYVPSTGMWVVS